MSKTSLFGTSGIRGDAEILFTNQFCFDLGRTFVSFLRQDQSQVNVAVGNDPRESSPRIKNAFVSGMLFEGADVYDQGVVSVPAMNYILLTDDLYTGSAMVTGSHIKPHLNGIKFFAFKEEILKDHEAQIMAIYEEMKGKQAYQDLSSKAIHEDRAKEAYKQYLLSSFKGPYPKWRVVVDPGNGAQSEIIPEVLEILGLDPLTINCDIQKSIICRDTEVEDDFKDLKDYVKEVEADFAIGFDSDGDRVIFIDEEGNFVPGDYSGALIAKHLGGPKVATPINTSQVVDHIGKEVVRTKVGSSQVVSAMKEDNLNFGFEANGGGIFTDMKSRDGGRSAIEILNILAKSGKKFSDLVAELPKYYLYRDKVDYDWDLKDKIISQAKEEFKGVKTEEMDGLKIWIDESTWILFRSSSNAPEFRVFAEINSQSKAVDLLKLGLQLVEKMVKV
jgi:phosphomannomutase/phosphoglucomutase